MLVITCRAMCRYLGRIEAGRSLGDVVVLARLPELGGDGSCLVYDLKKGLQPGQWMPAGSELSRSPEGLFFTNQRTGERLDIYIERIYSEHRQPVELPTTLTKLGAEREFSDRLAQRLHLIDPELTLIAREYRTPAGPVDLLCVDPHGRPVIVEVKRVRAMVDAVYQCRRYRDHLPAMDDWRGSVPRAVIVAPVLAKPAAALIATDPHLSFVRVRYHDLLDSDAAVDGSNPVPLAAAAAG